MPGIRVETPELRKATITTTSAWQIVKHHLYDLSPDDALAVTIQASGVTVWDLCFLEDLLHIVNREKGLLLDVAWRPHANPTGTYHMVLLRTSTDQHSGRGAYDWDNPLVEVTTRSLPKLLAEIRRIVDA